MHHNTNRFSLALIAYYKVRIFYRRRQCVIRRRQSFLRTINSKSNFTKLTKRYNHKNYDYHLIVTILDYCVWKWPHCPRTQLLCSLMICHSLLLGTWYQKCTFLPARMEYNALCSLTRSYPFMKGLKSHNLAVSVMGSCFD